MWIVLDNGKPADTSPYGAGSKMRKGIGWDNCRFPTKEEAYDYAFKWLGGMYSPQGFFLADAIKHDLFADPYEYSAYGDTIRIVEEK